MLYLFWRSSSIKKGLKMKWWVAHTFEGSEFAYQEEHPPYEDSWYGPFDSLKEAKEDAIKYHQSTLDTAKWAIYEIKKVCVKDYK